MEHLDDFTRFGTMAPTTDVDHAVAVLRQGGLVGLPTETVYGLAADADNPAAIRRVFAAKGRPADHPLIVHVANASAVNSWAHEVTAAVGPLLDRWWPGPLTVLLQRSDRALDEVTGGRDTVALRSPDHPVAQAVLQRFGGGLVAPSANRFGRVSPTTADDVITELGDAVDLVLDGGPCVIGIESTIVDLSGDTPTILRVGHITAEDLEPYLPALVVAASGAAPVAPGMLAAHYAPDARVVVLDAAATSADVERAAAPHLNQGRSVGVLAPAAMAAVPGVTPLQPAGSPEEYARVLYRRLRQADTEGMDVLLVVPPEAQGVGLAVTDRLRRAAHGSARPEV